MAYDADAAALLIKPPAIAMIASVEIEDANVVPVPWGRAEWANQTSGNFFLWIVWRMVVSHFRVSIRRGDYLRWSGTFFRFLESFVLSLVDTGCAALSLSLDVRAQALDFFVSNCHPLA